MPFIASSSTSDQANYMARPGNSKNPMYSVVMMVIILYFFRWQNSCCNYYGTSDLKTPVRTSWFPCFTLFQIQLRLCVQQGAGLAQHLQAWVLLKTVLSPQVFSLLCPLLFQQGNGSNYIYSSLPFFSLSMMGCVFQKERFNSIICFSISMKRDVIKLLSYIFAKQTWTLEKVGLGFPFVNSFE